MATSENVIHLCHVYMQKWGSAPKKIENSLKIHAVSRCRAMLRPNPSSEKYLKN